MSRSQLHGCSYVCWNRSFHFQCFGSGCCCCVVLHAFYTSGPSLEVSMTPPPWSKAGSDTLAGCLVQHHSWTYSHDPMLTSLSSFSSLTSTSELGSSFSSFPSLHPFYKSPDGLDCSCFPQDIYRPCFQLDVRRYLHVHHIYTLCPQPHPAPVHIFHCPSPIGNMFRA